MLEKLDAEQLVDEIAKMTPLAGLGYISGHLTEYLNAAIDRINYQQDLIERLADKLSKSYKLHPHIHTVDTFTPEEERPTSEPLVLFTNNEGQEAWRPKE